MFQIGDKIFYPAQGGGIIQTIEEKDVLGETHLYYIVDILHRNMRVMIPIDKAEQLGVRHIVDNQKLDSVLTNFHQGETDLSANDAQRQRKNSTKLKTGNIMEEVEVIRDLLRISNKRKLGMTDKNMLDHARQILISEVVLVKGVPVEQASDLLDQIMYAQ